VNLRRLSKALIKVWSSLGNHNEDSSRIKFNEYIVFHPVVCALLTYTTMNGGYVLVS